MRQSRPSNRSVDLYVSLRTHHRLGAVAGRLGGPGEQASGFPSRTGDSRLFVGGGVARGAAAGAYPGEESVRLRPRHRRQYADRVVPVCPFPPATRVRDVHGLREGPESRRGDPPGPRSRGANGAAPRGHGRGAVVRPVPRLPRSHCVYTQLYVRGAGHASLGTQTDYRRVLTASTGGVRPIRPRASVVPPTGAPPTWRSSSANI